MAREAEFGTLGAGGLGAKKPHLFAGLARPDVRLTGWREMPRKLSGHRGIPIAAGQHPNVFGDAASYAGVD